MNRNRIWLPITVFVLLATACSSSSTSVDRSTPKDSGEYVAMVVNSDLSVGRNFLSLAVRGPDGSFVGGPDSTATITASHLEEGESSESEDGEDERAAKGRSFTVTAPFIRATSSGPGRYGARVRFDSPGFWEFSVEFTNPQAGGLPDRPLSTKVRVGEKAATPSPGEYPPRSKTKTLASVGGDFSRLTSDSNPDPELYARSLDEVVGSGRAVVVMFATPLRCQSAVCGPALEQLKKAKSADPDAYYVHVDIYEDPLNVSDDTLAAAVREWRLPTEPMTFVLTPDGRVYDRFEGIFLPEQLLESLEEARRAG